MAELEVCVKHVDDIANPTRFGLLGLIFFEIPIDGGDKLHFPRAVLVWDACG